MSSLILKTTTRYLIPFLLMFSIFLLMRGHNLPGGGFAGGLVAAAAFSLSSIAFDVAEARRILRIQPHQLIAIGLFVAFASGAVGLFFGKPFLTGLWSPITILGLDIGTPLFFDAGVYLVVMGATLAIVFALEETE